MLKIERILNRRLISDMYISLNEFYSEVDLDNTYVGSILGWNVDEPIDFVFGSHLTDKGVPCISVGFMISPRLDYMN